MLAYCNLPSIQEYKHSSKVFLVYKRLHVTAVSTLEFSLLDGFSYSRPVSLHGPVHRDAKESSNQASFSMFTYPLESHLAFIHSFPDLLFMI